MINNNSNNKLELNPETVREAIEYWLNHVVFKRDVRVIVVTVGMNSISTPLTIEYQNKSEENDDNH